MPEPNGVEKTIAAAGSHQDLCNLWNVSRSFIYQCKDKGYFPLDRAKAAHEQFDIPLRELVAPGIRAAMDASA